MLEAGLRFHSLEEILGKARGSVSGGKRSRGQLSPAAINLIVVWHSRGFMVALLSTILNLVVLFVVLGAPEWFMFLSYRYAARAAAFEERAATSAMVHEEDEGSSDGSQRDEGR